MAFYNLLNIQNKKIVNKMSKPDKCHFKLNDKPVVLPPDSK